MIKMKKFGMYSEPGCPASMDIKAECRAFWAEVYIRTLSTGNPRGVDRSKDAREQADRATNEYVKVFFPTVAEQLVKEQAAEIATAARQEERDRE